MLSRVLLSLLVIFFIELWGIFLVGKWIGVGYTLGLMILTSLLGVWLARKEGLQTLQLLRIQLARNEPPGQSMLDGICILVGGILLIVPGFLSDLLGFLLLIPYTRVIFKAWLQKKITTWFESGHFIIFKR